MNNCVTLEFSTREVYTVIRTGLQYPSSNLNNVLFWESMIENYGLAFYSSRMPATLFAKWREISSIVIYY